MEDPSQGKSINFREVLAVVFKHKLLMILPLIIVTAIAYGSSFMIDPQYRSSAIIWIDTPSNLSRELIEIMGDRRLHEGRESNRRRLLALENELKSQGYLFELIRDLKLDNDQAISRAAARMREKNPDFSLEQIKFELLVDKLREQIRVDVVGQDQIEIIVETHDPVLARDMVNRLATIMEQEKTKYELEKILDNQSFADLQLQKMENDYREAVEKLTLAQTRLAKMHLPENITSAENRKDIIADIDKAKLDMGAFQNDLREIRNKLTDVNLGDVRFKYTEVIIELRTEIDKQIGTLVGMMEKYVWNEQNVINVNILLNDNLSTLEDEVYKGVDRQFASETEESRQLLKDYFIVKENIDVLNSKVTQLQRSLNKIDDRINLIPRLQAEINELEARVIDARKYRDAFKSEETTVEILSERARDRTIYKIIEPARIPLEPFWPNKKKIIILGFVLGCVLGGVAVVLAELFDSSFKRVEDVEQILNLEVVATIPKIEHLKLK